MVRWLLKIVMFIIVLTFVHAYAADLDVEGLLKKVDDVRVPNTDFSVEVTIETESGGSQRVSKYEVMMNDKRDALVKTIYPPNEKGQVMLMKGKDFWVYLPNVDQPVRLSLSQRLTGQVSNGDIARMNFSGDYKAALLRIEEADGKRIAVLELNKVADWVTYEKIILWVTITDARPLKAEFYTGTGILLKTCQYERYGELTGAIRPLHLTFTDAIKKGEKSVLTYSNMKIRKLPGKYFIKDYIKRLD